MNPAFCDAAGVTERVIACTLPRRPTMLYWAVVFFIVAIVAAIFGFGGIAGSAAGIAKILFIIFIVMFLISLVLNMAKKGRA
jgi:uncharacterized membrane protein YtjA (UPF0391 family)